MDLKKLGSLYNQASRWAVWDKTGVAPTLTSSMGMGGGFIPMITNTNVSTPTNGINTQQTSTKKTLESDRTPEVSQTSMFPTSQTTTCSLEDFLVKLSVLLENEKDLTIQGALYSLKLQGYSKPKDLDIYYLKMSKDSYLTMEGGHSRSYSKPLMNWGTTANGKFLTARISESHRIGKECSLSDILEEQVDQKYFLSEKVQNKLLSTLSREKRNMDGI